MSWTAEGLPKSSCEDKACLSVADKPLLKALQQAQLSQSMLGHSCGEHS